jgi:uncharacterized protein
MVTRCGRSTWIWVDDEDEFAEHRVSLGYPGPVAALAVSSCQRIEKLARSGAAPFDGQTAAGWLAVLAEVRV